MKLIDRCDNCKYLEKSKYEKNEDIFICKKIINNVGSDVSGLGHGLYNKIKSPEIFGCIFWENI